MNYPIIYIILSQKWSRWQHIKNYPRPSYWGQDYTKELSWTCHDSNLIASYSLNTWVVDLCINCIIALSLTTLCIPVFINAVWSVTAVQKQLLHCLIYTQSSTSRHSHVWMLLSLKGKASWEFSGKSTEKVKKYTGKVREIDSQKKWEPYGC